MASTDNTIRSRTRRLSAERITSRILNSAAVTPKYRFQLLDETRVSRATLSRYLSHLKDRGLIEEIVEDGRTVIRTTDRGREYLKGRTSHQIALT